MYPKQTKRRGGNQRITDAVTVSSRRIQRSGRYRGQPGTENLSLLQRLRERRIDAVVKIIKSARIEAAERRAIHDIGNSRGNTARLAARQRVSHMREGEDGASVNHECEKS